MDKLELYYDHYKESNEKVSSSITRRNKSYIFLCILETISFLMIYIPDIICDLLNSGINFQLNSNVNLSVNVLQTLVWLLIAYILIRYIQDVIYVERQYKYIEKLEGTIQSQIGNSIFNREGTNYNTNYPAILNVIDLFYKMFSPILFTIINSVKIYYEFYNVETLSFICDISIFSVIFLMTWLYFFHIHNEISQWFRQCNFINNLVIKINLLLRKV